MIKDVFVAFFPGGLKYRGNLAQRGVNRTSSRF